MREMKWLVASFVLLTLGSMICWGSCPQQSCWTLTEPSMDEEICITREVRFRWEFTNQPECTDVPIETVLYKKVGSSQWEAIPALFAGQGFCANMVLESGNEYEWTLGDSGQNPVMDLACPGAVATFKTPSAEDALGLEAEWEKVSDSELLVNVSISTCLDYGIDFETRFFLHVVGDSYMLREEGPPVASFLCTGVSVTSFPMYVDAMINGGTACSHGAVALAEVGAQYLFAPEMEVLVDGEVVPSQGTHDTGIHTERDIYVLCTLSNAAGHEELVIPFGGVVLSNAANCSGTVESGQLPLEIPIGESRELMLNLHTETPGTFSLDVVFDNNDLDENPYSITLIGELAEGESSASQPEILIASAGSNASILERTLELPEGAEPPMLGSLPLAAVYEVGELVTGGCLLVDEYGDAIRRSWLHVYVYAVDLEPRPEVRKLLEHWVARRCTDRDYYPVEWNTESSDPGVYDIYIAHPGGPGEVLRIQLVNPSTEAPRTLRCVVVGVRNQSSLEYQMKVGTH